MRASTFTAVACVLALILTPSCGATAVAQTSAQSLAINDSTVAAAGSHARAELTLPRGTGPFPAVVILHGCDGVGPHYRAWAQRLAEWGYAAVLVDSFTPRGTTNVCNHGMDVPPLEQAADGFAAAEWLRGRADIRADRIGVIGFSHGGWAVLKAVLAYGSKGHVPFAAAVAFYPGCERPMTPLVTDTLILIGDADDWTPSPRCITWRDAVQPAGHVVDMHVYPGAVHGFDWPRPRRVYAGHQVGGDPVAGPDAIAQAQSFFAAHLH